jgi:hypothetical protein
VRNPKLTIGMAHHTDYDGVYFTIQALRAYHPAREVELIVVDNSPDNQHGRDVANLVKHWAGGRYIPMPEAVGTTQPRERIFREATAPAVVSLDCHVLLVRGAVQALIDYYAANPDSKDIISGPMFFDDGRNVTTHFNEQWRGEMLGTWGLAWSCPCGARRFAVVDVNGQAEYWTLTSPQTPLPDLTPDTTPSPAACLCAHGRLPPLAFPGHEQRLGALGYRPLARSGSEPFTIDPDCQPFEIPGCGLGCFSMLKSAWPGFHPHFREFGGEEVYIHRKVRAHGGRAVCLPALGWIHRFARPGGVHYPLSRYAKVRNYVLGFQELGLDTKPIHDHFVATGLFPRDQWLYLLENPVARIRPGQSVDVAAAAPAKQEPGCPTCNGGRPQPPESATLQQIHDFLKSHPRDLDKHLDKIRELAAGAAHVTEIAKRRESTVALASAQPRSLVSHNSESDPLLDRLAKLCPALVRKPADRHGLPTIEPTEVLWIDDVHTADRLGAQLAKYAPLVQRRILIRGTGAFGERAEGSDQPGLLVALRRFLRKHPEWSVIYHTVDQYGLTAISRDPADKPNLPGVLTLAANFAAAVAAHVADGTAKVSKEDLEARLQVCTLCEQRRDNRCSACGCYVEVKAGWRTSDCPIGKWPLPAA